MTCRQRWQHNFAGGRDCDVFLDGRWRPARAERVPDVAETAAIYGQLIERFGWEKAPRRLGLRATVGRQPTQAELEDAVRRLRLSIILIEPVA